MFENKPFELCFNFIGLLFTYISTKKKNNERLSFLCPTQWLYQKPKSTSSATASSSSRGMKWKYLFFSCVY